MNWTYLYFWLRNVEFEGVGPDWDFDRFELEGELEGELGEEEGELEGNSGSPSIGRFEAWQVFENWPEFIKWATVGNSGQEQWATVGNRIELLDFVALFV